jgi:hypothetical protein
MSDISRLMGVTLGQASHESAPKGVTVEIRNDLENAAV